MEQVAYKSFKKEGRWKLYTLCLADRHAISQALVHPLTTLSLLQSQNVAQTQTFCLDTS